jgi:hypothetical protein
MAIAVLLYTLETELYQVLYLVQAHLHNSAIDSVTSHVNLFLKMHAFRFHPSYIGT